MVVDQQKLEQHLWGAANILRGKIDSGEYKSYIFGLLFFKRLSDVWQEEYEKATSRLAVIPCNAAKRDSQEKRLSSFCGNATLAS